MEPEDILNCLNGEFFEKVNSQTWEPIKVKCILCNGSYVYSTDKVYVKNLREHLRVCIQFNNFKVHFKV